MANTKRKKNAFFHPKLVLVKGIHLEWVNAFIIYSAFLSILSLCPISTFFCTTQEQTGDFKSMWLSFYWAMWREMVERVTFLFLPMDFQTNHITFPTLNKCYYWENHIFPNEGADIPINSDQSPEFWMSIVQHWEQGIKEMRKKSTFDGQWMRDTSN